MDSRSHPKNVLNPAAPWWFPAWGHNKPIPIIIPEGFILVNAGALLYTNAIVKPESQRDIAHSAKLLGDGKMGYTVLSLEELRSVYAKFLKNAGRLYDLSVNVVAALKLRIFAYGVGQTLPLEQGNATRRQDIIQLQAIITRMNGLIRRILFAEQFGIFPTSTQLQNQSPGYGHHPEEVTAFRAYMAPYLEHALADLEQDVAKALEDQLSGNRRGNRLPRDFIP
ncbi:hypothetical protein GGS26DRAFT_594599 [Hypomontagnella submonticulosa]|nr:hypothetical protein GGS26DRAFT_594599 [Hypomontagnella submonticulosa]